MLASESQFSVPRYIMACPSVPNIRDFNAAFVPRQVGPAHQQEGSRSIIDK